MTIDETNDAANTSDTKNSQDATDATDPVLNECDGLVGTMTDTDADGACDQAETQGDGTSPDTDADGTPNAQDPDDDNDGTPTANEDANLDGTPTTDDADQDTMPDYLESNTADTDNDGTPNVNDPDDDGDTVPTDDEVDTVGDETVTPDSDNDSTPDSLDPDDDGDGIPTADEDTNTDGAVMNDDADADSIPDYLESVTTDTDNDGTPNQQDPDDDGDGVSTIDDGVFGDDAPLGDTDNDNAPNNLDADDDGDDISTIDEDANRDAVEHDDTDDDTVPDYLEPDNADTDQDGTPNAHDPDDDGDGIPTVIEIDTPWFPNVTAPIAIDEEQTIDNEPRADSDHDAVPDYLDTDDDGDGTLTKDEDTNRDGNPMNDDADRDTIPDSLESNTRDTDRDGKPNVTDNDDDNDRVPTSRDTSPYSHTCYTCEQLTYELFVIQPNGRALSRSAVQKTAMTDRVVQLTYDDGDSSSENNLTIRMNTRGCNDVIATVMRADPSKRQRVRLRIFAHGDVEKDFLLLINASRVVYQPQRIVIGRHVDMCANAPSRCDPYLTTYMSQTSRNNPKEIIKLQTFLKEHESMTNLELSGAFDSATDVAVRAFQEKYKETVLAPWGIEQGTGYVYLTTSKKINDLACALEKKK